MDTEGWEEAQKPSRLNSVHSGGKLTMSIIVVLSCAKKSVQET